MVVKVEMTAEAVSREVRNYSIMVGFLLVAVFVVPCVAFALLSKYCQKQRRKRRVRERHQCACVCSRPCVVRVFCVWVRRSPQVDLMRRYFEGLSCGNVAGLPHVCPGFSSVGVSDQGFGQW